MSHLHDYFNLVSNEVFTSAENSRLESKEDIPEVKEGTVSRALNIADLKEEETDKIIENYASTNVTDGSGNPNLHRFITYLSHIKRIGHEVINRQHTTIEQPHENREYNVMVGRIPSIPPSLFNIISHMSLDNGIPVDYIPKKWLPQYHLSLLLGHKGRLRSSGSGDGQFDHPYSVAVDSSLGVVYVVDKDNNRIQKFDSDGRFITKWGSKNWGYGRFEYLRAINTDPKTGRMYTVDANGHKIEVFALNEVEEWFKKGHFYLVSKTYREAIECFDKAIEMDRKYAYAWIGKAIVLLYSLQCTPEEKFYDNIEIGTRTDLSFYNTSSCTIKSIEHAIKCFDKAIELDRKYAYAWIGKGIALCKSNEFGEAIECFNKALQINPDSIYPYNGKGVAFSSLKNYEPAEKSFDKAIELDPRFESAYINKANLLVLRGMYGDAINYLNNATEIDPKNVQAWNNKAICYYIVNDYDRAILSFNKVLKIMPDFADAFYLRACSKVKKGNVDEGLKDLAVAIKLDADKNIKLAREDKVFQSLKSDDRYKSLIEAV